MPPPSSAEEPAAVLTEQKESTEERSHGSGEQIRSGLEMAGGPYESEMLTCNPKLCFFFSPEVGEHDT